MTGLDLSYDLNDIKRLFGAGDEVWAHCRLEGSRLITEIDYGGKSYSFSDEIEADGEIEFKRFCRRAAKKRLYGVLKENTGELLPWGSLTGIRPVSLFSRTVKEMGYEGAQRYFLDFFDVSPKKLELLKRIEKVQRKYLRDDPKACDLYVGIPFCRGRCTYCSFISAEIEKSGGLVDDYAGCLIKEIEFVKDLIEKNRLAVNSIYVGGGTPSSLPIENLRGILGALKGVKVREFTFEAGRPDSFSEELLQLLKRHGVNRVSVNPQSANDETLKKIGRRHTFSDCVKAYELAKRYGFAVNMDIIAGLPGEGLKDFMRTVDAVISLKPHNVTVHTLCVKSGAILARMDYSHTECASYMLDYAQQALHNRGYNAYYMYRQKNAAGNLENVGYSLKGYECLYNIDNMEDSVSAIACGGGAISKRVYPFGRIERLANPKDIRTYCLKISALLQKKAVFFSG